MDCTGTAPDPRDRQDQSQEDNQDDILHDRHAEHGSGERPTRVELVHERERHHGGGRDCDGAQRQRHSQGITKWLMYGEREPRADAERHQGYRGERERDRTTGEAAERRALRAQCSERHQTSGRKRDERRARVADEAEGGYLVRAHQVQPRGAGAQSEQYERRDPRQPRPARNLTGRPRGDEQEPERECGSCSDRARCGEAMKKGHHQAQCEKTRDPPHGAKICVRARF